MKATCPLEGCNRDAYARGWCRLHYERWRKHGHFDVVERISGSPIERLMARVTWEPGPFDTDCWISYLSSDSHGYTRIYVDGRNLLSHRVSYEHLIGPIPEGLELDHLCRVPACVNPGHLEPVTHRVNTMRGNSPAAVARRTNQCQRGHSLSDAHVRPDGRRYCVVCVRLARQARLEVSP